jgi:adenine-specific DNA-methyltransferase
MPSVDQLRTKLINKLKDLFQLNQPDLDFGFYRIMHTKAQQVNEFIQNDLLKIVQDAFGQVDEGRKATLKAEIEQAIQTAIEYGATDPESTLKVKDARARYETARDTATSEGEIYDHLYRFFERYYDDGDFISRRYLTRETPGKAAPFAVPYNGEEVKLHWANADQYYIKTTEYFTNFSFDLTEAVKRHRSSGKKDENELFVDADIPDGLRVQFRIADATEGDHGNVKASEATKRFFIIHRAKPVELTENGNLIIHFEYRPDPAKSGQEGTWRDTKNKEAVDVVLAALKEKPEAADYLRLLSTPVPTDKDRDRTLLARYVNQYTARNTMDYFIHKDLGGFLKRELDFYIKNEIMRLDDIENAEAPAVESYLAKIKVLRKIAGKLIEFLAQLENFQKKLWLKKKFVVETNYCLTLDRVPEEFYPEIAANQAQHDEWVKLFAIDEIPGDAFSPAYAHPLTVPFLKANDKLVLDTRFFDESFKARLIASIQNFDEQCDGLLIHSENFQALNLLQERYREQVKCVYIDPPYNTSEETFIYKNAYKHSSWMALISERIKSSRSLTDESGALLITIDDEELFHLKEMLLSYFDESDFVGTIVIQSNPRGRGINSHFATSHEYCLVFAENPQELVIIDQPLTEEQSQGYKHGQGDDSFRLLPFRRSGGLSTPDARPHSEFPLIYSIPLNKIIGVGGDRTTAYPAEYNAERAFLIQEGGTIMNVPYDSVTQDKELRLIFPIDKNGQRRVWRWSDREKILHAAKDDEFIVKPNDGSITVQLKDWIKEGRKPKTLWIDSKYDASSHGTVLLMGILGDSRLFGYPKSFYSTYDSIHAITGKDLECVVLDYFAGSGTTGHAVINLNREDEGKRKYILVEMGDYFNTVLRPRIAKVVYSKDWKDGKPTDRHSGVSQCFKTLRLEGYEDTLNNLRFVEDATRDQAVAANPGLKQDYTLHYLLDVETRGSQSLLNIDAFADPFAYTLQVKKPGSDEYVDKTVDLLETFNYLLGLRVEHVAAPQTFTATFKREADPDLPEDQCTKLVVEGRIQQDANGPWGFRKVEGRMPRNPYSPNDGLKDKVLIVWRNLTGDQEKDNLMLDEWFKRNRISTQDWEFNTIYVNGSNNLPNLQLEGDTWKVRLIEEEFSKRMWDMELE